MAPPINHTPGLHGRLRRRQMNMIAMGGVLDAGPFVGAGSTLMSGTAASNTPGSSSSAELISRGRGRAIRSRAELLRNVLRSPVPGEILAATNPAPTDPTRLLPRPTRPCLRASPWPDPSPTTNNNAPASVAWTEPAIPAEHTDASVPKLQKEQDR